MHSLKYPSYENLISKIFLENVSKDINFRFYRK